jgi:opacity protein-like surface antigen
MKETNLNKFKGIVVATFLFLALPLVAFGEGKNVGDTTFSIGPRATYVDPKDADDGEWVVGVQARLHLTSVVAVEGSIDYHKETYDPDIEVIVYPVQASLMAYLMPQSPVSPYLLGGAGWYYTRVKADLLDYDETESRFGVHAGVGLEAKLNEMLSIDGSYRYVWMEELDSPDPYDDDNYDASGSMITAAVNLLF